MTQIKIHRTLRKPRTTNLAGLVVCKRLAEQVELLTPLDAPEFIKLHGHSLKSIFLALLVKAFLGTPSMAEFETKVKKERFIQKIIGFSKHLGKTVLGRNMKRFKPKFLQTTYYSVISRLIDLKIITLDRVAIDSTFIEVFGKEYQKATIGWGNKKTSLGYKLSVALDLDSKLPVAYILSFGCQHDSQFLVPLVKIIESKYGVYPNRVVLDRGYYNKDFFHFFTQNGIEFEQPVKKYTTIRRAFDQVPSEEFHRLKEQSLHYTDTYLSITGYGYVRVVWLVYSGTEDWMPENLKPGEWWGLITNRADLSPLEVIEAYKERWEIEVFFRGMRQRLALGHLPGRDFRQIQGHIFFVFMAYILLMLIHHLIPPEDTKIRINLKVLQEKVIFVKAVILEKGRQMILHFTQKEWLFLHLEVISLN